MQSSSFQKKINPGKAPEKISVFSEPTDLALKEWELKGLHLPDISIINSYRKESCLLYTSPSPRDATLSRMPSSA